MFVDKHMKCPHSSWLHFGNGVLSKHRLKVSMVNKMFFMGIYQMVKTYKVSESARLAGKTLIWYLGVFCTNQYLKILITGPKIIF